MATETVTTETATATNWGKLVAQLAEKYTAGDRIALLRELFRALPTGAALQATNYKYTDPSGVFHVVYNGVDFSLVKHADGQYGTEITPFVLFDAENKPAKTEKYNNRKDARTLDNAMLVAGHQAGAIGRRCADIALSVKDGGETKERKPRANNAAAVRDEVAEMRAQLAKLVEMMAEHGPHAR